MSNPTLGPHSLAQLDEIVATLKTQTVGFVIVVVNPATGMSTTYSNLMNDCACTIIAHAAVSLRPSKGGVS